MKRYFIGTSEQPRARRAGDVVAIAFGLILLLGTAATYGEASATDQWILDLLETLPSWFDDVWRIGYFLGILFVVAVFAGAVVGNAAAWCGTWRSSWSPPWPSVLSPPG